MFGEILIVSEDVTEICEVLVCQLLGSKHHIVSDICYRLFSAKKDGNRIVFVSKKQSKF